MIIDDSSISDLVKREIQTTVNQYVESVLSDQIWKQDVEQQITQCVQQRIAARFQNISSMPDIVDTIVSAVRDLFTQGHVPGMDQLIDPATLQQAVDSSVQVLINDSLNNLVTDPDWINKIQQSIESNVVARTGEHISGIDIRSMVAAEVRINVDQWRHQLIAEFDKRGIRDEASACELVISDGSVVAQSGLACGSLLVEQDLVTHNLVVTGTVNTDCASWHELAGTVAQRTQDLLGDEWRQQLVQQILELAQQQGIDFSEITIKGTPLVSGNNLNSAITHTAIRQLGVLENLQVSGNTSLAKTLFAANHRVGINTDSPDMALSVWDEEVSISLGKISRDRAWIGSSRQQALDIGVNRRRSLSVEPDGLVSIDRLRLDRWRISFANAVPNHSGTRGDLVINHDPRPDTPFAWQCLGGFQWRHINLPCA